MVNEMKEYSYVGWKCPACGRGNAPWSAVCPCVNTWPITRPPSLPDTWTQPGTWPQPGNPIWVS
jgi:hypothetical protein